MFIKRIFLLSVLFIGSSMGATLQISVPTTDLTILNDSSGAPKGGMAWGIVVDTSGNGFANFDSDLNNFTLANGFINADDFFYLSANATLSSVDYLGVATQIIANYDEAGITGGKSYKILWFDTTKGAGDTILAGDSYGVTSVTAVLPASNGDDVTPTDFYGNNGSASLTVIPEPSAGLLAMIGALALLRRRR